MEETPKAGLYTSNDGYCEVEILPYENEDTYIDVLVKDGDSQFMATYSHNDLIELYEEYQLVWKEELPNIDKNINIDNQPIRNTKKTGRNEPCPCGSGKKYKRCCG